MNPPAQFWIVAGPNGAGKTTCVQAEPIRGVLPAIPFLNPDDATKQLLIGKGFQGFADAPAEVLRECFVRAAEEVERQLIDTIGRRESVGIETVLSTDKYRPLVEQVRRLGGELHLIYVTVASPDISVRRVAIRVAKGGHDVPSDKIAERYHRSLANLGWFAAHSRSFWVLDNSDPTPKPVMRAYGSHGKLDFLDPDSPPSLLAALASLPKA